MLNLKRLSTWPHHWLPLEFFPSVKTRTVTWIRKSHQSLHCHIRVTSKWVNYNAFRSCVYVFVCKRRKRSPDDTQVFHSELIQGDISGFSCEHGFTRHAMGLSERHLRKKKSSSLFRAVKSFSSCCLTNESLKKKNFLYVTSQRILINMIQIFLPCAFGSKYIEAGLTPFLTR